MSAMACAAVGMCSRCARIMTTAAIIGLSSRVPSWSEASIIRRYDQRRLRLSREHPLKAHAALLAMSVIWGVNFAVSKVALEHLSPLAFNALRFPMASLL